MSKLYALFSEGLQTTFYKKKSSATLSLYSSNNSEQVKILCNVIWEAPGNIA